MSNNSKNFPITHPFEIFNPSSSVETLLIQAAFNNVCLKIAINDDAKITEVIIPARS